MRRCGSAVSRPTPNRRRRSLKCGRVWDLETIGVWQGWAVGLSRGFYLFGGGGLRAAWLGSGGCAGVGCSFATDDTCVSSESSAGPGAFDGPRAAGTDAGEGDSALSSRAAAATATG